MGRKRNNKNRVGQSFSDKEFESDLFFCDRSPIFGRYLKAKVNIPKGSIILKEHCLVAGPKSSSKTVCIGCHSDLLKTTARIRCSKCNWPLCTSQCQNSPFHSLECNLFTDKNILPPSEPNCKDYGAIAPLRALLLKIYKPKDWQKFNGLEHHNDYRKILSVWKDDAAVVKVIREKWKLDDMFSEEEIFSACGIYEINGFELGDFNVFGGIFPTAAMIAHDCVPNAGHFENLNDGVLEIVTLVDIPTGSPITMCYDCSLKGSELRRKQLWRSKYFKCTCNRCIDPSELGTNFSTLLCDNPSCKRGLVLKNNESEDGLWKCDKCFKIAPNEEIDLLVRKYSDLATNSLPTIKSKEEFLQECKSIFHPNHYIPFSVKFELCMAYGHDEGYSLYELTQIEGHRKLELCHDVLKVLDILTPGLTTSRGNILFEMQAAEVLISRNLLESGKCSKALIKRRLQNTLKTLNEAIQIFELSYPMRMLAESAKTTTLVELKTFVNSLK